MRTRNPGEFLGQCIECNRLIRVYEEATQNKRREEWVFCQRCWERAERLADPFERAYQEARAHGWED